MSYARLAIESEDFKVVHNRAARTKQLVCLHCGGGSDQASTGNRQPGSADATLDTWVDLHLQNKHRSIYQQRKDGRR